MKTPSRLILASSVALAAALPLAADKPLCTWNKNTGSSNIWWFASVDYWKCQNWTGSAYVKREPAEFPRPTDCVWVGINAMQSPWVYLKDGDNVSILGLNPGFGNWSGNRSLVEVRTGAVLRVTGNIGANWEGVQLSSSPHANGYLWVNGGSMYASGVTMSGNADACTARLRVSDGGGLTNGYFSAGGTCPATIAVDNGAFVMTSSGSFAIGGGASPVTMTVSNGSFFRPHRSAAFSSGSRLTVTDSRVEQGTADWSQSAAPVRFVAGAGKTTGVYLTNSTWVVYDPAWDNGQSAKYPKGAWGYRWGEWYRMEFQNSGYAEFIQKDSSVTNNGVWFRTSTNADGLAPRYVVDGGELYVYNFSTEASILPSGQAYMGFAAANGAPNSGTIEFLNQAKVSFPSINTNIVVSGNITALKYAITTNRPHLKFTLAKGGHRPAEIRIQTDVMGMYSFEPQGGLQVVQTNRFALLRHSNKSKTLTTCAEPQFRAPNADLWTTGGFADIPREWGVTLKDSAEIKEGADLGAGVASGCVKLPRCNPAKLDKAQVVLKMAPGAKTLAEVAADMTAAGYPATVKDADTVVVDLLASGMLKKGRDNKLLFDFNAPQNAVDVRDGVKVVNAVVTKVTTVGMRKGLLLIFR